MRNLFLLSQCVCGALLLVGTACHFDVGALVAYRVDQHGGQSEQQHRPEEREAPKDVDPGDGGESETSDELIREGLDAIISGQVPEE